MIVVTDDNIIKYIVDGKLHREDGPAMEHPDGTIEWYLNGKLHREDGPAIEYPNGSKQWWMNGKLHREDGPAIIYRNGTETSFKWFLNGNPVEPEELPCDYDYLKLKYLS